jgi:hypothetical protein
VTVFSEDNAKATASRLNSAVYRLLMLLSLLTTCDCFLRDHPSQYQAVRLAGGASHPDYPRILDAFNHAAGPLRAKDVCEALGHELLPKNVEGTRAKLKRLVKLGILTEADTGNFARKQ